MSTESSNKLSDTTAPTTDQKNPLFQILRIYVRDCSIEVPHAPQIFLEREAPQAEISLDINAKPISDSTFDVTTFVTLTAKINDKVAFVVEVKQAGIFEIQNFSEEQKQGIIWVAAPTILFPYLRAQVADLINRTGFPPFHMNDISFEALYRQRLAQEESKKNNTTVADKPAKK